MFRQEPLGDVWSVDTLQRATKLGQKTYARTVARKVEWPKQTAQQRPLQEDPPVYTSLDDAFSTVVQFMSQTSRQCKRYYRSHPPCDHHEAATQHCNRFHTPHYTAIQRRNPLQRSEDVHVLVAPGSYAVTAGAWGSTQQQTHVVHVNDGQTVELDFVM